MERPLFNNYFLCSNNIFYIKHALKFKDPPRKIKGVPVSRPIRRTMIFSLEILEKNNDEYILILVIYWKKTGLLDTKISNYNIIYSP